jgi:HD-like signal output (HDOD) protein
MKFECPSCHKCYDVPDEKLPPKKKVIFPCPNCKGRIELDLEAGKKASPAATANGAAENDPVPRATSSPGERSPVAANNGDFRKKVLRKLKDLPPMPQIVFKARQVIADPDSEMAELSDLLESDQAIATKVLKLANSAYYGLSGKVSSIRHASSLLGYNALGQLISMVGGASVLGKTLDGYDLDSAGTWRHSLLTASASRILALKKDPSLESDAFSAGLIHDVGKLVLDTYVLDRKEEFERLTSGGRNSMLAAEQRLLGLDHADIGYEVCQHWNIPATISQAIKHHHDPVKSDGDMLSYIVFMANSIANIVKSLEETEGTMAQMEGIEGFLYMIDDDALEFLDLTEDNIPGILNAAWDAVNKLSEEMQILTS